MISFDLAKNIDFTDPKLALKQMWSYITAMQEQIEYFLRNLEASNFNDAGLKEINAPVMKQLSDVEGNVSELAVTAEGLASRVSNAEGNITTVTQTANGAMITAQNAAGQAQSVALTVDGFTITNPSTGTTTINGDKIQSGTITGVTLASSTYNGGAVVIEDGGIKFFLNPDDFFWLGSLGRNSNGQFELSNLSSYNPLKIKGVGNMSIDVNETNTIYIGTSTYGENVTIGNAGGDVRLVGNVYVNGVPLQP